MSGPDLANGPAASSAPVLEDVLRERCRELLAGGTVDVVIGYGATGGPDGAGRGPLFVTDPDDAGLLVFDERCVQNLTVHLTRPEVKALGRPAVVAKGCDARAVVVLVQESQFERDAVHVVGVACAGTTGPGTGRCASCDVRTPENCDEVIGEASPAPAGAGDRYATLEAFLARPPEERFAHWTAEFARCTRCYACRQVCPLCYCNQCVMDKNRPQVVDSSPHVKGNLAFHITRAFHLAGRCVGCGACTQACPAGIDLSLLNLSLARAAEEEFGARPGTDPGDELLTGAWSAGDREGFIR